MNSGQEIPGELVVSGGDTAEVFEYAKAALDDISAFVGAFIEAMDDDAVGFVGNGRRERQNIGRRRDIGILASGLRCRTTLWLASMLKGLTCASKIGFVTRIKIQRTEDKFACSSSSYLEEKNPVE